MAMTSLQGAYDQTRRWIESNDSERAIGLAQHILQHYPNNLEAYRMLGEAYLARRQLDQAQEAFEHVLRSDPENIPAHVGLGITFERQGKLDRAVPEFEQAWEIKPDLAELRSQLLRLYAEAWGSEHAQLRLSRAGLARLYAKGHMLPQAISEFRQVIADQPNRHDATIALAEALWRDGQENESIALCRDILAQQPMSLKANLLLGYLLLAQGNPEGQPFWATATQIDPFMTVAQAMFETLPSEPATETELPEWDETAWRRQQELERQPIPAATRPIPVAIAPRQPLAAATPAADNDDFLAVLLAGSSASVAASAAQSLSSATMSNGGNADQSDIEVPIMQSNDDEPTLSPFSLADLGPSETEIAGLDEYGEATQPDAVNQQPAESTPTPFSFDDFDDLPAADDNEPAMTPFSLADLGLTDDEIADLDVGEAETASAPAADGEPAMTPFSLADLGLTDDEITNLNDIGQPETASAPADDDEPAMTPFSLADLGLTDDEIANLNDVGETETAFAPAADEPAMTPFSLADLGLTDDEIANLNDLGVEQSATPVESDDEPTMMPFSLDDLGLTDDEIANLNDLGVESATAAGTDDEPTMMPFSLDDLGLTDDEIASLNSSQGQTSPSNPTAETTQREADAFISDLLPFSLDELDSAEGSSLPSALQPFSLDDAPPRQSNFTGPETASNRSTFRDETEDDLQSGGYSWQQPPQRSRSGFASTPHRDPLMPEGESIFDKLKQRKGQEPEATMPEPVADISDDVTDDRVLFSMDDVSLRDDSIHSQPEASAPTESAPAASTDTSDDLSSGLSSGQIQPFSLADLGLNAEEIAALGLGGDTGAAQNFSAMLETATPGDEAATDDAAIDEAFTLDAGDDDSNALLDAFSLDERDDEDQPADPPTNQSAIEAFQADTADTEPTIETLSPFSLADLGLSDEEIAALGLDEPNDDSGGLGITEEELAGMDMGGDLDLSAIQSLPMESSGSGDPLLDRLMTLGREQGYVDIADIIDGVANPEAEADRIEQIGQILHENSIKIYDGDEEVDMDAEYTAEDDALASADIVGIEAAEPNMSPFSLADLGLTDDEIASLGIAEPTAPDQAPAAEVEPNMSPFSLADLGLTDDEIASLGLAEQATTEPEAAMPAEQVSEPDTTAFSFSDLGLTDDEITSLGAIEPEIMSEPAAPAEAAPPIPASAQPATAAPAAQSRQGNKISNSLAESVPALATYLQRLQGDPANHPLRLSLARISGQLGQTEAAIQQYKNIIRQNVLLDVVVADLGDLLDEANDEETLQRIHRLLGDAYSKQGMIDEAMTEYNWTYDSASMS